MGIFFPGEIVNIFSFPNSDFITYYQDLNTRPFRLIWTLKGSFLLGLHVDSPEDLAREAAFKIYYWHDESQEELLQDLLTSRHQLAQLCGYPTFAHRATVESLAETPEKVEIFLNKLSRELRPRVSRNYDTMLALKKKGNPTCSSLEMWDVPYFTTQAKNNFFQIDSAQISEYFSLGVCMEGLNTLYQNIFSVYLELEAPAQGEIWHPDVYKLAVRDCDSQEVLGHIYCDFFMRSGKPYQDCHFTIQGGRLRRDNSYQNPVVVLMLNLPVPGWSRPTLLTSGMIDNLFHEMGHAMHSMLARTKYQVKIKYSKISTYKLLDSNFIFKYWYMNLGGIREGIRYTWPWNFC